MTLLITAIAAVIATIIKCIMAPKNDWKVGSLALIYWGASLMWMVDAIAEIIEDKDAFFHPTAEEFRSDVRLGLTVVALGIVIWLISLLISKKNSSMRSGDK